jgi:ribosomal protein S6
MPLYELIMIARANYPKNSSNVVKLIANTVLQNGGNVRDVSVLGDRVLSRKMRGYDKNQYIVGRYIRVLFDGNQKCKEETEFLTKTSYEQIYQKTF